MPVEPSTAPIEAAAIESSLDPAVLARLLSLECAAELESTNRHLLAQSPPTPGMARAALAEFQHGGRGRHGRRWIMPAGSGIALSIAWHFATPPAKLSALSLGVGAAARRAIHRATELAVDLKWPNDLILDGGKLGGILVEIDALADGYHVVAGVGINVKVPRDVLERVSDFGHGARDLAGVLPDHAIDRSRLAAALIEQIVLLFSDYENAGFSPYRREWLDAHVLNGEAVELSAPGGKICGIVRGIADDGALIVEQATGELMHIVSGDVTLRPLHDARD